MHMNYPTKYNLATEQELPRNTFVLGNGGVQYASDILGKTEVVVIATEKVNLAIGKSILLTVEDSDGDSPISPRHHAHITATAEKQEWEKDEVLIRLIPSKKFKTFIRVQLGSDDASISGSVDIVQNAIPNRGGILRHVG